MSKWYKAVLADILGNPVGVTGGALNVAGSVTTISSNEATKVTVSGTTTYVANAPIGSSQASAVWQVKKIAVSGSDTIITWADGDELYNNIATDLTTLTYS